MEKTALIAGASGLVGEHLLGPLLASYDYDRVISLSRRPLPIEHPKLRQTVLDFDALQTAVVPPKVDDVFCTLGTTLKKAGSRDAFRKVDLEYVVTLARWGLRLGAASFQVVSAVGAHPRSRIFYSRIKGEMEAAVEALGYDSLNIFRPSMILGPRKEVRIAEQLALFMAPLLTPLLFGPVTKYGPVSAQTIAKGMMQAAGERRPGVQRWEFDGQKLQPVS